MLCSLISQVGSQLGRPPPPTVASPRGRIGIPRFRLLLWCPKREESFLRQIFSACGCTSPPTPLLLFTQVMGHPTGTCPYAKAVLKNASETSRWNLHDILYFSVCHFWVLLNYGLYPKDVFWGNVVAIRPQRSPSSNVLAPDTNCLNHLKIMALDGDWSAKQYFKLLKHLWKDFPWQ